jgi:hypothetical protein
MRPGRVGLSIIALENNNCCISFHIPTGTRMTTKHHHRPLESIPWNWNVHRSTRFEQDGCVCEDLDATTKIWMDSPLSLPEHRCGAQLHDYCSINDT